MASGFPVVVVASGGAPVISVASKAPAATVATNGRGIAVTLVLKNGTPLVIQGL